jgi:hypothetical protein
MKRLAICAITFYGGLDDQGTNRICTGFYRLGQKLEAFWHVRCMTGGGYKPPYDVSERDNKSAAVPYQKTNSVHGTIKQL